MEHISIDKLHELLPNLDSNDLVLDVRTAEEFEGGHIKGARNQTHEGVGAIAEELKNHGTVYVHCKMGGRAQKAAEDLTQAGLTNVVCVSQGGMQRWLDMGWEIE